MSATRRPTATWAQFLECAPDFVSVVWSEDECFDADIAPLIRALSFYDNFNARVFQDGLPTYFSYGRYLPDFMEAPAIVAIHPLLGDVAALMREAFSNRALMDDVHRLWRDELTSDALRMRHTAFVSDFHHRAFPMLEIVRTRVNRELLLNLCTYVDLQGVDLNGDGMAQLQSGSIRWMMRFLDGFPVGPNVGKADNGAEFFVQFAPDRMRVEFNQFGSRRWVDLASGEEGKL